MGKSADRRDCCRGGDQRGGIHRSRASPGPAMEGCIRSSRKDSNRLEYVHPIRFSDRDHWNLDLRKAPAELRTRPLNGGAKRRVDLGSFLGDTNDVSPADASLPELADLYDNSGRVDGQRPRHSAWGMDLS